jgi:hypothetical protein
MGPPSQEAPRAPKAQEGEPECGYAYDDEEEGDEADEIEEPEESVDAFLEACVEADAAARRKASAKAAAAAGPKAPKVAGEYELLRLAKLGVFKDFERYEEGPAGKAANLTKLRDNQNRTALHFAADGGSLQLVLHLLEVHAMAPTAADERGMTAYHVAVLVQADECAAAILQAAAGAVTATSYEECLLKFAPLPPKFSVSKAAPKAIDAKRVRKAWGADVAAPSGASAVTVFDLNGLTVDNGGEVAAFYKRLEGEEAGGASNAAWSCDHYDTVMPSLYHAVARATDGGAVTGVLSALPLGNVKFAGATHAPPAYNCGRLAAEGGAAADVIGGMRKYLEASAVVFQTATDRLPLKTVPAATFKWFCRCINPVAVQGAAAAALLPDFDKYDTVLRADAVARGAAGESALPWRRATAADALAIAGFAGAATATADVTLDFSETAVKHVLLGLEGVNTYVLGSAAGVTDVVALSLRSDPANAGLVVASLAFALFSTVAADKQLLAACELARQQLPMVAALYATNTMGLGEAAMRNAFFDEVAGSHRALYVLSGPDGASLVKKSLPGPKIMLPMVL